MKVVSNTAISLDGRINTREGHFTFFGSARDHARMSALRADADAVLVGGATFRNWPHPALPDAVDLPRLRGRPWNVVVSRALRLAHDSDWARDERVKPLLLTSSDEHEVPASVEVAVHRGGNDIPVAWMLEQLRARGVERLLIEAGGDLLFQWLAADAIDEMHVTLCPLIVGGASASLVDGSGFDRASLRRLRLLAAEVEGDEVFLHYARPAAPAEIA